MKTGSKMTLRGFREVNWEIVFGRFFIERNYQTKSKTIKNILKIIIDALYPKHDYFLNTHDSKILFFISSNNRENVTNSFETVRNLTNGDILSIYNKGRHHNIIEGFYFLLLLVPLWAVHIRKVARNLNEFLWMIVLLQQIYVVEKNLSRLDISKYKLLVTYYDSLEPEAYMVQSFKNEDVKTATLQHGQFVAKCADTFIDSGIELRTFNSDYFLCWNKFTFDEAIKCGIPSEKLIIVGIWSYINKQRALCDKINKGIFGVVLGHPSFEKENLKLIEAANILSEKYGMKYYLKLHPFYKEDYFVKNTNKFYLGNIQKGISILDYANQVDFTLIGSTSVFVELVYVGHDVFRYSSGEANDKYKSIKIGKYFRTPNEIDSVYQKEKDNDYTEQLFDYLCTVSDVTAKYNEFFEKYI